jgi:hypothetical protein
MSQDWALLHHQDTSLLQRNRSFMTLLFPTPPRRVLPDGIRTALAGLFSLRSLCRWRARNSVVYSWRSTRMASTAPLAIPEGYTLHSENSAHILLPASADAFLNPVQEFNRDLSVACIRVWGDELDVEKERQWKVKSEKAAKGLRKGKKQKSA